MSLGLAFQAASNALSKTDAFNAVGLSLVAPVQQTDAVLAKAAAVDAVVLEQETLAGLRSGAIEGVVNKGAAAAAKAQDRVREKEKEAAKERANTVLLLALLEDIDRQIAANKEKIHENEQSIEALNKGINALQNAINSLERGEDLLLNANGSFVNADLEQAVKEFEDKYGIVIDRENPDSALLQSILKAAEQEKARLEGENLSLERENEVLDAERETAVTLAKENPEALLEIAKDRFSTEEQERILELGASNFEHDQFMEIVHEKDFSEAMQIKIDTLETDKTSDDLFSNGIDLSAEFEAKVDTNEDNSSAIKIEIQDTAPNNVPSFG